MRIEHLSITNFRAITDLTLSNLGDTVIVAGPNGCGKSCVFDAIRLLKSVYGGYQPNEWQNWFGEFQINVNDRNASWQTMLQDRNRPVNITAQFSFSPSEIQYVTEHARELLEAQVWREVAPELAGWRYLGSTPLAAHLRVHQPEVSRRVDADLPGILNALLQPLHTATVTLSLVEGARTLQSRLLELVFSQYDSQNIGIIDYHGANRNYGREQVGGINLNIESSEERMRQHALYNYVNKYANLKSEMAGSYVRHLLSKQANSSTSDDQSLVDTLKELFATFFPGKEFLGPQPTQDGRLLFPVRIANGAQHDIDELSSGEKEVLYGYLRLRNAAPQHSVLLIDEPELHLNPRLMMGLTSFYHRHLGRALDNQLWLVTHSDTLIREAVGQSGFSVFHLQPPGQYEGPNQAAPVLVGEDIERLIVELVGDLAAYRPGAKIVVFEGGGDTDFDSRMTCTLFPQFQAVVNPISGGNKNRVNDLYELLESARRSGHLPGKVYAITDWDGEGSSQTGIPTRHCWNAYHIENYLLVPEFMLQVLQDLNLAKTPVHGTEAIAECLRQCAGQTISSLIGHKLTMEANRALIECINLKFNPSLPDPSAELSKAISRSADKIRCVVSETLTLENLKRIHEEGKSEAMVQLANDEWRSKFRGRDVLRRFVGHYGGGVRYETFRDLIIARMRDAEHQPPGMKIVVDAILNDRAIPNRAVVRAVT